MKLINMWQLYALLALGSTYLREESFVLGLKDCLDVISLDCE